MRQRICSKLESSLNTTIILLLITLLAQDYHSSARQVNGNLVTQQSGLNNNSLPSLSERANGVNSRYLSAASTASLAAATVAAANQQASSNSATGSGSSNNNNNNQEANSRNFLLHQQQQQNSLSNTNNNQLNNQANGNSHLVNGATGSPNQAAVGQPQFNSPQASPVAPLQQQPQPLQQQQQTPIMSTTFTYNPITGQFVPSDLTTGLILPQTSQNIAHSGYSNQYQQPAPLFVATNPYSQANNYNNQQPPARFNFPFSQQNQLSNPYGGFQQPGGNQFISQQQQRQQQQQQQFNRRNGYGSTSSGSRPVGGYNLANQQLDDEGNGFFQQQPQQQVGPSPISVDFGDSYGNNQLLPGNNYLGNQHQQQLGGHYGEHQIVPQPSSLSSLVATPTTSFSTAFSGPPAAYPEQKSDQCLAADNRHGTCYQASECIKRGGTPMGKCGGSNGPSNELPGSSYVCCLFDVTCGQFAAERFVYFRNPNYPNSYEQSRMCRAKIGKLDKGVCQFRLDLIRFDVAKPTNGNCSNDMFVVSGQNENYVIPKICGLNDGQHYYVGVDESGVITLHMMMMGYYRRQFEILITQIPCRSDFSAPAHCLQYYMGTHGTIKSFNYDDEHLISSGSSNNYEQLLSGGGGQQQVDTVGFNGASAAPYGLQFGPNGQLQQRQNLLLASASQQQQQRYFGGDQYGGYPNDLDYTMCIRKESGFCSITYQLSRGEQGLQPFAVGHSLFGLNGNDSLQHQNWQPVSTECRDDYLLVGGVRLCSGSSGGNPQSPFGSSIYDQQAGSSSIQFAQNGTILNAAGVGAGSNQQLQLQQQHHLLMQQLARLQQQQQQQQLVAGNASNNNNSAAPFGQQQAIGGSNNLEQQQAAIVQQAIMVQQQLNLLAAGANNNNNNIASHHSIVGNRYQHQQPLDNGYYNNNNNGQYGSDPLQGAIITDTTSGPFILSSLMMLSGLKWNY